MGGSHRTEAGPGRAEGYHLHIETGRGRGALSTLLAVPEQPIGALADALHRLHDPHGPADLDARLGTLAAQAPEGTAFVVSVGDQAWVFPSAPVGARRVARDVSEAIDVPQVVPLGHGDVLELLEGESGRVIARLGAGVLPPAGHGPEPVAAAGAVLGKAPQESAPVAADLPVDLPVDRFDDVPEDGPAPEAEEEAPAAVFEDRGRRRRLALPVGVLGVLGIALAIGLLRGERGAEPRPDRVDARVTPAATEPQAPEPGPDGQSAAVDPASAPAAATGGEASDAPPDAPDSWVFRARGPISSSPLLVGNHVLFGSRDSTLYCLDARTGEEAWTLPAGSGIGSSPRAARGTCFVGTYAGKVLAVDIRTGSPVWEAHTGGRVISSPAVVGDRVVVGSYDGFVHAFDRRTGAKAWAVRTGAAVRASPERIGADDVVVGSGDGMLYRIRAVDGEVLWRRSAGSAVVAACAADRSGRRVVAGTHGGAVLGLDAETGNVDWRISVGAEVNGQPRFAGDVVLVGTGQGVLYALDPGTGESRWTVNGPRGFDARPVLVGSSVIAPTYDGTVHVLDPESGTIHEERPLGAEVFSSPAAGNLFVYVGTMAGDLHALPLP